MSGVIAKVISVLIFVLEALFAVGILGSALVVLVTFIEDLQVFRSTSSPQYRDDTFRPDSYAEPPPQPAGGEPKHTDSGDTTRKP